MIVALALSFVGLHTASASQHSFGTNIISSGTVYTVTWENGRTTRRPYTSEGAFLSYSFNSWGNVLPASAEDLVLPVGSFIPPRDGTIVCADRGTEKGTCYLITNGTKAGFTSESVFTSLGFKFRNALYGDVSFLPTASNISNPLSAHLPGTVINRNGTLYLVVMNGLFSIPDSGTLMSWGYNSNDVIPANTADSDGTVLGTLRPRLPEQVSIPSSVMNTSSPTVANASFQIVTDTLPAATVGASYSAKIDFKYITSGTNYATNATFSGLPAGITTGNVSNPNSNLGIIYNNPGVVNLSGIPTQAGNYTVTLTLSDQYTATFSKQFTLTVGAANQNIDQTFQFLSTSILPPATVGKQYSTGINYSYSGTHSLYSTFSSLPTGLCTGISGSCSLANIGMTPSNNGGRGTVYITGIPTQAGTYNFDLTIIDQTYTGTGSSGISKSFSLTVLPSSSSSQTLSITTATLPNATVGQAYSYQLQASGGVAPYKWSYTGTSYPSSCCVLGFGDNGLFSTQLNSTVSNNVGTFYWDVVVTDAVGSTSTKRLYLTVVAAASSSQPTLVLSDTAVNYYYSTGSAAPTAYTAHISNNSSTQSLTYNISVPNQPAWLNTGYATSTLSLAPLQSAGVGVSVSPAGLAPGEYSTRIYFNGSFSNSPASILVTLFVY